MKPEIDQDFEVRVGAGLRPFIGRSVRDIGSQIGIRPSAAKHYGAMVLRELAAQAAPSASLAAFASRGIEVKTVRKPRRAPPFESMSFPAFRNSELVKENWADSSFRKLLRRLLILQLEAPAKSTPQALAVFERFLFWSPTEEELALIGGEWERFRVLIAGGLARRLPPESETKFVHVRPKAKDKDDVDSAPTTGQIVRKCFWLNRDFVNSIIETAKA